VALQTLYEYEFRDNLSDKGLNLDEVLTRNLDRYADTIGDKDYVRRLVKGVVDTANQLDARLQPIAPDWPIKQISAVDRATLRIGVYELESMADIVPPKVVINEAVELAKSFGSENSSKFVNGVLGTIYREIYPDDTAEEKTDDREKIE
jgi:N utilization substance protein B